MKKILCFGDSNTWGHNPIDCSRLERPWPEVLREKLTQFEIIEDGLCTRTTKLDVPGENGKNGFTAFKKRIEDGETADLAIIMLGTNDTLNYFDCSPEESAEAIREYAREWKKAFPESELLIVSPIYIREQALAHPIFKTVYSESSIKKSHRFAECYKKVAEQEGLYFLDATAVAQASEIDGIHMVPEEHEKLAEAIAEIAVKILN
jgi:lysophospholipase L1-like esterase